MKKTLYIVGACWMVLSTACTKSLPAPENSGMSFEASTVSTKSHFGESGLTLYWDEYDDMAVYSLDANATDPFANVTSGLAYIQSGFGETNAHFQSTRIESEWFNGASDGESRRFIAYYPAYGQPQELMDAKVGDNTVKVLPVFIEDDQNGLSDFGRYHFMLSRGNDYSKGQSVILQNFEPMTSLLKFKLQMETGYDYEIDQITIQSYFYGKVNEDDTEDRYNWDYYIRDSESGTDYWRHIENIVGFRYISATNLLSDGAVKLQPFFSPEESYNYSSNGRYLYLLKDFAIDLKDDAPTQDLYAVVFPTYEYPLRGSLALRIDARYDVRSNERYLHGVEHTGYVLIPSPGFEAGKRYDFTVTLSPDKMYVQSDPNAPDWGYEVINW